MRTSRKRSFNQETHRRTEGGRPLSGREINAVDEAVDPPVCKQVVRACGQACVEDCCMLAIKETSLISGRVEITLLFPGVRDRDCLILQETPMSPPTIERDIVRAYEAAASALERGEDPQVAVDSIISNPNLGVIMGTLSDPARDNSPT